MHCKVSLRDTLREEHLSLTGQSETKSTTEPPEQCILVHDSHQISRLNDTLGHTHSVLTVMTISL